MSSILAGAQQVAVETELDSASGGEVASFAVIADKQCFEVVGAEGL